MFTAKYYDISQGSADGVSNDGGAWNQSEEWEYVKNREDQYAVDGGDGSAMAELPQADGGLLQKAALHTKSKTDINPTTGTDLGAGPGAGQTKKTPSLASEGNPSDCLTVRHKDKAASPRHRTGAKW